MTISLTLETALAVWTLPANEAGNEDECPQIWEAAERYLLDYLPTTPGEAAIVLRVLRDNVICGARPDCRDIRALDAVSRFLESQEATMASPAREATG